MKNWSLVVTVTLLALGVPVFYGHGGEQDVMKKLMTRKLENAQKVLEGVAVNDFDLVVKHADELIAVSKAAEWRVLKTPQYELYSNEFRRSAETMIKQAKAKNTDGVALAYVDMTLSCVKCHKYVREVRMARLD